MQLSQRGCRNWPDPFVSKWKATPGGRAKGDAMAKFLFVYHGGSAPESEEEGAAVMQAWNEWLGGLGSAVVDQAIRPGHPPQSGPQVDRPGQRHNR